MMRYYVNQGNNNITKDGKTRNTALSSISDCFIMYPNETRYDISLIGGAPVEINIDVPVNKSVSIMSDTNYQIIKANNINIVGILKLVNLVMINTGTCICDGRLFITNVDYFTPISGIIVTTGNVEVHNSTIQPLTDSDVAFNLIDSQLNVIGSKIVGCNTGIISEDSSISLSKTYIDSLESDSNSGNIIGPLNNTTTVNAVECIFDGRIEADNVSLSNCTFTNKFYLNVFTTGYIGLCVSGVSTSINPICRGKISINSSSLGESDYSTNYKYTSNVLYKSTPLYDCAMDVDDSAQQLCLKYNGSDIDITGLSVTINGLDTSLFGNNLYINKEYSTITFINNDPLLSSVIFSSFDELQFKIEYHADVTINNVKTFPSLKEGWTHDFIIDSGYDTSINNKVYTKLKSVPMIDITKIVNNMFGLSVESLSNITCRATKKIYSTGVAIDKESKNHGVFNLFRVYNNNMLEVVDLLSSDDSTLYELLPLQTDMINTVLVSGLIYNGQLEDFRHVFTDDLNNVYFSSSNEPKFEYINNELDTDKEIRGIVQYKGNLYMVVTYHNGEDKYSKLVMYPSRGCSTDYVISNPTEFELIGDVYDITMFEDGTLNVIRNESTSSYIDKYKLLYDYALVEEYNNNNLRLTLREEYESINNIGE